MTVAVRASIRVLNPNVPREFVKMTTFAGRNKADRNHVRFGLSRRPLRALRTPPSRLTWFVAPQFLRPNSIAPRALEPFRESNRDERARLVLIRRGIPHWR